MKAVKTAGTPNRTRTRGTASLYIRATLKRLFARWTTAVAATATSIGKKRANAGNKSVPSPNPTNSVIPEMRNEKTPMRTYVRSPISMVGGD